MATLTVWRFDSPYGARNALDLLERLREEELLQLDDAAIRDLAQEPEEKPQDSNSCAAWPAWAPCTGSFWGLLFGLLFFVPLLGMAVGAAFGAVGGSRTGRALPALCQPQDAPRGRRPDRRRARG